MVGVPLDVGDGLGDGLGVGLDVGLGLGDGDGRGETSGALAGALLWPSRTIEPPLEKQPGSNTKAAKAAAQWTCLFHFDSRIFIIPLPNHLSF